MEQEAFIVWSPDVPLIIQQFKFEQHAQEMAERYARAHRGARICVAQIVAFVKEPLPDLQWSDDRKESQQRDTLGAAPREMAQCANADAYGLGTATTEKGRRYWPPPAK